MVSKRLRGCVLTRFLWFRTFAHENLKNRLTWKQKVSVFAFCSATCKLLCISCLTEIRVVIFTTLKMPKSLTVSVIRAARPGGSEPPPSLGVRPKLAQKWSRESSAVLRACERSNVGDVYSPWGDVTLVTEGNESHEARARTKKSRGMFHGFFCASEGTRTHTHEGTRS